MPHRHPCLPGPGLRPTLGRWPQRSPGKDGSRKTASLKGTTGPCPRGGLRSWNWRNASSLGAEEDKRITRLPWGIPSSESAGCPLSSLQRTPFLPSVHRPSQVAIGTAVGTGPLF